MKKEKTAFILGAWVMILPFLGFPLFWKNLLFVATGLFLMLNSYLMYRHKQVLDSIIKEKEEELKESFETMNENSGLPTSPLVHAVEDFEQVRTHTPTRHRTTRKKVEEVTIARIGNDVSVMTNNSSEETVD